MALRMVLVSKIILLAFFLGVTHGEENCANNATECESYEICVYVSPTWSQCVDCSNFVYSCPYYDNATLSAASEACQMNCPAFPCTNYSNTCYGDDVCVEKTDGTWSQCVDCSNPDFQNDCVYYDTSLRSAAVETCQMNCLNTQCTSDDSGMQCLGDYTCVEQSDGNWGQCVDCKDPSVFQTDCYSWSEEFKASAEAACGLTCP
mmetsp:Transcript_32022/g.37626  ORF Transcript_32022/g.37626 Transcript_32022/m.37626 type:complete len:204 (-) Transcript_32022:127-738(-)